MANIHSNKLEHTFFHIDNKTPHVATRGPSILRKFKKLTNFISLKLQDKFTTSNQLKSHLRKCDLTLDALNAEGQGNGIENMLKKLDNKTSQFLSQIDYSNYISQFLNKSKHDDVVIHTLGINSSKNIRNKKPSDMQLANGNLILIPFVYPKKGSFSYDHIVLIAVDKVQKQILYYDSLGLTSDDPTRLEVFADDQNFNMRRDLIEIGNKVFGNEPYEIIENKEPQQKDPFNCGAFVLTAMTRLVEGKPLENAIDNGKSPLREIRRNLANKYIQNYLQRHPVHFK